MQANSSTGGTIIPATYEEYKAKQAARVNKNEMNQQDFLNLLITQMKNQDPTNPMDNAEFTQQTTSFSQLEQLVNMNKSMETLSAALASQMGDSGQLSLATSLMGKTVEYSTNTLSVSTDGSSPIGFFSSGTADSVDVKVYNEKNELVSVVKLNDIKKGQNTFPWDGKGIGGVELEEGIYTFEVTGSNTSGEALSFSTISEGVVKGVKMSDGKIYLDLGTRTIPMDYVYSVKETPAAATK